MKTKVLLILAASVIATARVDAADLLATTNLPLSGTLTVVGPYMFRLGQRFTTDNSSELTIRGIGVFVGSATQGLPYQPAPNLHVYVVPDQDGHPPGWNGPYVPPVGGLGEYNLIPHQMNYFGGGEITLSPNTSYWAIFESYYYPFGNDGYSSLELGTVSGNDGNGLGPWLQNPQDYVSARLELDSHYDTGQYNLRTNVLLNMVISTDSFEPTPEPSALALLTVGLLATAAWRKSQSKGSAI